VPSGELLRTGPGRYAYYLEWLPVPGQANDVVHLRVTVPPGLRWDGTPPPATITLGANFKHLWGLRGSP
jgi:hypothetical protein